MNFLLAPGIRLMNHLRYPWKFAVMGLVAVLVIGYLSVLVLNAMWGELRATRRELEGLPAMESLYQVVRLSQQHRGLSAGFLSGGEALRPKLEAKTNELTQVLGQADQLLKGVAWSDGTRARWQPVLTNWEALRTGGLSLDAKANAAAHTAMIARQILVLHDVGDDATLALDPEADSYYLVETLLRRIPEMTERLGRLRAMGTGALAARTVDDQKRLDISGQLGELSMALAGFQENLDRAGAHNPELAPRLAALKAQVVTDTEKIREELAGKILKGQFELAPSAFFEMATQAIDGIYTQAQTTLIPEVTRLLEGRVRHTEQTAVLTMLLCGAGILVLAYLSASAYQVVTSSVRELSRGANELAGGNLRAEIDFSSQDELREVADQFRAMAGSFREVIQQVQRNAEQVTAAAVDLSANSERVSRGSEQQSEAASSMAAAVEEMTVGVDEIARNARDAEAISHRSGDLSATGGEVVAKAMGEMESIADVVRQSASVIQDLGVQSSKISGMVNAIQEIADQTNLLALNAAIEAARAGETGRGFAVVADEVRKLAERTGQATREITTLVANIQSGTQRAVDTMRDGVSRVEQGVALTAETGQSMAQIRAGTGQVLQAVGDISLALREQSAASTEIARNVEQIASRAEENSAEVRETAATAQHLESLARTLQDQVGRFRV